MPSENFYISAVVGVGLFLAMGLILTFGIDDRPSNRQFQEAGQYLLGFGVLGILVVVGVTVVDVYPSIRDWRLARQEENLLHTQEKIEIEKKKWELKRKQAEVKEYIKSEEEKQKAKTASTESMSEKIPTANKESTGPPPDQKVASSENVQLESGGSVSSHMKKKEATTPYESSSQKNDSMVRMEMDKFLKCLLALYVNPKHYFGSISIASRVIYNLEEGKRSGSAEQKVSRAMRELEHYGLVKTKLIKQYDSNKGQKIREFRITDFGMKMCEKALTENVTNWGDFVEKYKIELRDKK